MLLEVDLWGAFFGVANNQGNYNFESFVSYDSDIVWASRMHVCIGKTIVRSYNFLIRTEVNISHVVVLYKSPG